MTKDELIGIFRTGINNCKLVYASMVLFSHEDMPSIYEQWSSVLDIPRSFDDFEIIPLLRDREVSKIAFGQLYDSVFRAAIKELFEVTKTYCQTTNQLPTLQSQSWYQFWRIIRNCFSHDFRFEFNFYDQEKLPVSWRNITIDISMEGKPLTHGDISREELLYFLSDVVNFIDENLS